jgi:hypothetical protein
MKRNPRNVLCKAHALALSLLILVACGLPPEAVTAIDAAVDTLESNKALAETFVRDVKTASLSDSEYQDVRDSYESARNAYNDVITALEAVAKKQPGKDSLPQLTTSAEAASADFLQKASRALDPSYNLQSVDLVRAITIPVDVAPGLKKLPRAYANGMINQYDRKIRWMAWRDLAPCGSSGCTQR